MCSFIIVMPFQQKKKRGFHPEIFIIWPWFFISLLIGLRSKFLLCLYNKYYKKKGWSMRWSRQRVKDGRTFGWCAAKRWLSCRCLKCLSNSSILVSVCLEWTSILASSPSNFKSCPSICFVFRFFLILLVFNFCPWPLLSFYFYLISSFNLYFSCVIFLV